VLGAVLAREALKLLISAAKALRVEADDGVHELHPHVKRGPYTIDSGQW
jgi:hypothetical protein